MAELTGRRFLVSGASGGIGEATARCLVAAGAAVAIMARRERRLRAIADDLGALPVVADVTDGAAVAAGVEFAAGHLGGLDGLVNVAGIARHGSPTAGDLEDWDRMLRVNVLGLLAVTRAAIPFLCDNAHADVVNVGSMSGIRRASVRSTVYSGTKSAAHAISGGMREELSARGVRVCVVAPSYVRTEIFDHLPDPAAREAMRTRLDERGLAPDVVAREVVHVVSRPPEVCIDLVALSST